MKILEKNRAETDLLPTSSRDCTPRRVHISHTVLSCAVIVINVLLCRQTFGVVSSARAFLLYLTLCCEEKVMPKADVGASRRKLATPLRYLYHLTEAAQHYTLHSASTTSHNGGSSTCDSSKTPLQKNHALGRPSSTSLNARCDSRHACIFCPHANTPYHSVQPRSRSTGPTSVPN